MGVTVLPSQTRGFPPEDLTRAREITKRVMELVGSRSDYVEEKGVDPAFAYPDGNWNGDPRNEFLRLFARVGSRRYRRGSGCFCGERVDGPTHGTGTGDSGHDVLWARESMKGRPDRDLLARAAAEARTLLTFDKDFGELAFYSRLQAACGGCLQRGAGRIRKTCSMTLAGTP